MSSSPSQPQARGKRICIVGLGSISQNPRVVKEANALADAGYDVIVLFPQQYEWARVMDQRILEQAKWRADILSVLPTVAGTCRRFMSGLQSRVFRSLCRWTTRFPVVELGWSRYFLPLLRRAIRHRSDLYIGHSTGSLPVVACAASWTGAKFAFDFEDFHRGEESSDSAAGRLAEKLIAALEDRYLPAANFTTAASWGIADEVAKSTSLSRPTTILNAFPWTDRGTVPVGPVRTLNSSLSLYWFSQIISRDRGLQDVINAMSMMCERVELHIRGRDMGGAMESLRSLADVRGVCERVYFHPLIQPDELLYSAVVHDVGLCLEVPTSANKDACISNKIFLYMLAGLAIVASRTRGQTAILNATPGVGFLYDSGDAKGLATILDRYASDRDLLNQSKTAALTAARARWNWERESKSLVSIVETNFRPVGSR